MARVFANSVLERRRARGLSQADLARGGGISRQAVAAIESGRVQPGVMIALALARTLGSSVEDLFGALSETRLDAELTRPTSEGSRASVAIVGGRVIARPLDSHEAALSEPAGALVASVAQGRAAIEPLAQPERLETTVFVAGCEPALGLLAAHVNAGAEAAVWFAASNRDALADLRAQRVHAAALHGSAEELQRLVQRAGEAVDLYELATIEEGWILAHNNPKKLRGARDLGRTGIRLANRRAGSAARALLDAELRRAGVASRTVSGYSQALDGHADVARAVAFGYADIGIGVACVAEAFHLNFIPLRSERCVLAINRGERRHRGVISLVNALRSTAFRRDLSSFGPYDTTHLGEIQ